ncbi:Oxygen-independent coproporphyrinogen-III oxidase-like protein [Novipirellula aureliae]|uniref:Heme chaperone HemW n=1 Tax=Novipirellula aureliae TaxID=2527966 RepID=A0A5C6E044_9BACT|nr:radical SAM family heme chaperone HemW [Novipirellula aureliae]TWU43053.1 Oxygen-independent coproporphyrinogen-III oxidase-like protein [Novipirellula aureliae]
MTIDSSFWPTPRAAYVHVPFCRHRCGYCNFSVIAGRDDLIGRFIAAVDRELSLLECPEIDTLFIGGGTPTHLPTAELSKLLSLLQRRFRFVEGIEWSVEANPEDIDSEKLDLLVEFGVNRISLGVQSFQSEKLKLLQRGHRRSEAMQAIASSAARIENVSIDLIFAAPGETVEGWRDDLRTALGLPIKHLSAYALTFEKGTSFWSRRMHGKLNSLDENSELEMYELTRQITRDHHFKHYEISNFAFDGYESQHNIRYWEGRGWFAAGPGAARFVAGRREVNHRSPTTYLSRIESGRSPNAESELITPIQYARERAAFGIRMLRGIDLTQLSIETEIDLWARCDSAITRSLEMDLIERIGDRLRLTEKGILFADTVASDLLS